MYSYSFLSIYGKDWEHSRFVALVLYDLQKRSLFVISERLLTHVDILLLKLLSESKLFNTLDKITDEMN